MVRGAINFQYNLSSPGLANALLSDIGVRTYGPNANAVLRPAANTLVAVSQRYAAYQAVPGLAWQDVSAGAQARYAKRNNPVG